MPGRPVDFDQRRVGKSVQGQGPLPPEELWRRTIAVTSRDLYRLAEDPSLPLALSEEDPVVRQLFEELQRRLDIAELRAS